MEQEDQNIRMTARGALDKVSGEHKVLLIMSTSIATCPMCIRF